MKMNNNLFLTFLCILSVTCFMRAQEVQLAPKEACLQSLVNEQAIATFALNDSLGQLQKRINHESILFTMNEAQTGDIYKQMNANEKATAQNIFLTTQHTLENNNQHLLIRWLLQGTLSILTGATATLFNHDAYIWYSPYIYIDEAFMHHFKVNALIGTIFSLSTGYLMYKSLNNLRKWYSLKKFSKNIIMKHASHFGIPTYEKD